MLFHGRMVFNELCINWAPFIFPLGKPVVSEMDEFPENFRRGGVVSVPKNFVAIFFVLETALLVMNFRKNFEIGGVGEVISNPKNFVGNSVLVVMNF